MLAPDRCDVGAPCGGGREARGRTGSTCDGPSGRAEWPPPGPGGRRGGSTRGGLGLGGARSSDHRPSERQQHSAKLRRRASRRSLAHARPRVWPPTEVVATPTNERRCCALPPVQFWEPRPRHAGHKQPGRLARDVAIVPLLNVARVAAPARRPPTEAIRARQTERTPGGGVGRVLEHAAPAQHRGQGGGERPAVVSAPVSPARLDQPGEARPPRARRMCHHRARTRVEPGVARLWPRVHAWEAVVGPSLLDVESCHLARHGHRGAPWSSEGGVTSGAARRSRASQRRASTRRGCIW